MKFLKKLFVRRPEDCLEKGDALMASNSIYDARVAYEDGLQRCKGYPEHQELSSRFASRIDDANRGLAALNIEEACHAIARGAHEKAVEHLELALTLTGDTSLRSKADLLLTDLLESSHDAEEPLPKNACSSCSHISTSTGEVPPSHPDSDLLPHEYYELLILQLPEQLQEVYATLGEDFAQMYIAASQDRHQEALDTLEKWFDGSHRDIYSYEKGKILHRLGKTAETELCMRDAIGVNIGNPLPHLGLALLLMEENRLDEAEEQLDRMIEDDIFTGQSLMMRGEVYQLTGNSEAAINQFIALLDTPLASTAADKLHGLLLECGRQADAAVIFKKYLGNSCKH